MKFFVPLFSNRDINGSDLMKSLIKVAREKYNGMFHPLIFPCSTFLSSIYLVLQFMLGLLMLF